MRYAKESFGIKVELIVIVAVWSFFLLAFVLMSVIKYYQESPEYYWAAAWQICIPLFITNVISVWVPLIRSFFWANNDGKPVKKKNNQNVEASATGDNHAGSVLDEFAPSTMDLNDTLNTLYVAAGITGKTKSVANLEAQSEKILDSRVIIFVMFHEEVCQKYFKGRYC